MWIYLVINHISTDTGSVVDFFKALKCYKSGIFTENQLILSVASLWEIQIKSQLGKIKLRIPLAKLVEGQQNSNCLSLMPINATHVYALGDLPSVHKDPFDRMIVAQAKVESLCFINHDTILKKYPVDIRW